MDSMEAVRLAGNLVDYLRSVQGCTDAQIKDVATAIKRHLAVIGSHAKESPEDRPAALALGSSSHRVLN